jgi:transcriptional regulator with XRE-family HTH domain
MNQTKSNHLNLARQRLGLSMKDVAAVLGHRDTATLSRWETGDILPSLPTALKLEIVYRQPIAFLFPHLYTSLREHIRREEQADAGLRKIEETTINA